MTGRTCWILVTLALAAACGPSKIQVSGQVVGMLGLPLEGVTVGIPGHPPTRSDANGKFAIGNVEVPYDVLVKRDSPAGASTSSAAWLALSRSDPVLVISNAAQGGTRQAVVCGALTGQLTCPALTPYALPAPGGAPTPVDPSTNSFCSAVQWLGDYETTASVHVLGPDYLDGSRPGDFTATGFPLAGSLTGLRLGDRDRLDGADISLGPAPAGTLKLENGGWIGTTQTQLWAWAFFAERWPGGGSPLIQSFSPPPWDSFAVPQMPNGRVRLFLNSVDGAASAVTARTVGTEGGSVTLQLPDKIQATEPSSLASLRPGTRFRWGPPGKQTVYMMYLSTSSVTGSTAFFQVAGPAPDLPFPDFSLVGAEPLSQRANWQAFSLGPLSGIDSLVTTEHLGMALLSTDGLGEDEWFISGTTGPSQ